MIERRRLKEPSETSPEKAKRKKRPARRSTFTEINLRSLPARKAQYNVWDAGTNSQRGLGVLVNPLGTKTYRVVYYYPGSSKPHSISIGRVGELSLADARERTRKIRGAARNGENPSDESPAKSLEYKVAVEAYIKFRAQEKDNTSGPQTQTVMLNNCKQWWNRPVATLRYQEIDMLLAAVRDGDEKTGKKPRRYLANRLYSHLKDFFKWCAKRKMLSGSPMTDMDLPFKNAKRRDKPWYRGELADGAIKALWSAAEELPGDEKRYLKLLLFLGKRKTATAQMRWEQIDDGWFWHAKSESKNKRLHPITIPSSAQHVLHPRGTTGAIFGKLNFARITTRIRHKSKINDFFFHDLRHLAESKAAELGVPPHIRDLLYDHAPKRGTGAVYDHHEYRKEMLEASEKWCKYVERLVTPEGVARLR